MNWKTQRAQAASIVLVLIVSLGLYLWRFDSFQVGTYMDDAQYIVLAESILQGSDYGLVTVPGEVVPSRYPFGWPMLLAPALHLFGDFQKLRLVALLFTLANTALIAGGWRYLGLSSRRMGLCVAALCALTPLFVGHARMVMSEPAFTLFALLGLVLTVRSASVSRFRAVSAIGLGIVWMFAAYIRTIGFTLVVASALYFVLRSKWSQLALAILGFVLALSCVVALTVVDWQDLVAVGQYRSQLTNPTDWGQEHVARDLFPRTVQGIAEYASRHLRDALVPFVGGPTTHTFLTRFGLGTLPYLASAVLLSLILIGYASNVRGMGLFPAHLFVPLYLSVTVVWPWRGERFLYGILPFLFAFLLMGGQALIRYISSHVGSGESLSRWSLRFGLGVCVLLIGLQVAASASIDDSLEHVRDLRVGTSWISENAEEKAIVIAEQPEAISLYAHRATVSLPGELQALDQVLHHSNPVYLLIAPRLQWSDTGELEYSHNTRMVLGALRSHELDGELVFEDPAHMIQVYLLGPPRCTGEAK